MYITKMGADKLAENTPIAQIHAQSQKFLMKKGFIGRP